MKKFKWLLCSFVFLLAATSMGMQTQAKRSMTIYDGVYIGDTDVSGMTKEEATEAVNAQVEAAKVATITLTCVGEHEVTVTPEELGIAWKNKNVVKEALGIATTGNIVSRYKAIKDLQTQNVKLPISYKFDHALVKSLVEEKCDDYNQEAIDIGLKKEGATFTVIEGQPGIILDNDEAVATIEDYLTTNWDGKDAVIELPAVVDDPKGSVEALSKVKDVLGTFTTSYTTSGADRSANVENGCRLVNGHTVYPGESFSIYESIKPFSVENGYHMAGSYVNGMVVDSLGGGICQVSTTLYNAVLRAELEVTERHNHSMIVGYVPASADAAIAESSGKDFVFTNNTEYPIYIEGITEGKHITFNVYGVETRPANRKVEYESEILETIQPDTENIIQSASQPVGFAAIQSAHIGYKARLWKIVTVDGKEESREIVNSSNYKMAPRTMTVGVATDNPEAYNQIQAAIATGSIDQVKAVSDAWAAANAAAAAAAAQAAQQPADAVAP